MVTATGEAGADEPPPTRARRRSPQQVRRLLLEAAAELFSTRGYSRTGTRAIAERADVAEVVLFRHFGNKANLFREAVQAPVLRAISNFSAEFSAVADEDPEVAVSAFVTRLYEVAAERRGAMLALTDSLTYTEEVKAALRGHEEPVAEFFEELEKVVLRHAAAAGSTGLNPPLSARTAVGAVAAFSIFEPWLLPGGSDVPDDDRVVIELTAQLLHGTRHRPTA